MTRIRPDHDRVSTTGDGTIADSNRRIGAGYAAGIDHGIRSDGNGIGRTCLRRGFSTVDLEVSIVSLCRERRIHLPEIDGIGVLRTCSDVRNLPLLTN
ncbi:hypothetical protein QZM43_27520 [Burkholderia orbicola]|nr:MULTISPECIES: hypothetical protein [Burkholderia cepacia complex]MDN7472312.1 hypothetical protein [Burkholderia orbicola]MDN7506487.1 hypothetical protein [Burkholderia orbicola]